MTLNFVRRTMSIRASVMLAAETREEPACPHPTSWSSATPTPTCSSPATPCPCSDRPRPWSTRPTSCSAARRRSWPAVWPASAWRPRSRPRSATTCTAGSSATPSPSAGSTSRWLRTDPSVATGLSVVLSVGDRAILTHPGTIATTGPEVVDEDLLTGGPARPQRVVLPAAAPGPAPAPASSAGLARPVPRRPWTPTSTRPGTWRGVDPPARPHGRADAQRAELRALTGETDLDAAADASSSTSVAGSR